MAQKSNIENFTTTNAFVFPTRAEGVYIRELEERAKLLRMLGFTKEEAICKLNYHFGWHIDFCLPPNHLDLVDSTVSRIFS